MTYREAVDIAQRDVARRYVEELLTLHRGNVSAAAHHAGIERESFHQLLRRCDARAEQFRDEGRNPPGDDGDSERGRRDARYGVQVSGFASTSSTAARIEASDISVPY
jgi:hypothetical protein